MELLNALDQVLKESAAKQAGVPLTEDFDTVYRQGGGTYYKGLTPEVAKWLYSKSIYMTGFDVFEKAMEWNIPGVQEGVSIVVNGRSLLVTKGMDMPELTRWQKRLALFKVIKRKVSDWKADPNNNPEPTMKEWSFYELERNRRADDKMKRRLGQLPPKEKPVKSQAPTSDYYIRIYPGIGGMTVDLTGIDLNKNRRAYADTREILGGLSAGGRNSLLDLLGVTTIQARGHGAAGAVLSACGFTAPGSTIKELMAELEQRYGEWVEIPPMKSIQEIVGFFCMWEEFLNMYMILNKPGAEGPDAPEPTQAQKMARSIGKEPYKQNRVEPIGLSPHELGQYQGKTPQDWERRLGVSPWRTKVGTTRELRDTVLRMKRMLSGESEFFISKNRALIGKFFLSRESDLHWTATLKWKDNKEILRKGLRLSE